MMIDVYSIGQHCVEGRHGFSVRSSEMRYLIAAIALAGCVVLPQTGFAEPSANRQIQLPADHPLLATKLPAFLQKLGVALISRAHAAECTAEGETCASNEQCCPGLECIGGPPATCSTED
jgi:hypothetical protein